MPEITHNRVASLRQQADVTQQALADALHVSRQTVIAIEKGNYTPSVSLAMKIAGFFKKSVEDVFFLTYEK